MTMLNSLVVQCFEDAQYHAADAISHIGWAALQVVALVGPSGGGKSSIVKLVERFYLPSSGAVMLDGRDVGLYDAKWLKQNVALVAQVGLCTACLLSVPITVIAACRGKVAPFEQTVQEITQWQCHRSIANHDDPQA